MKKKHALIPLTLLAALGVAGCKPATPPAEEPEQTATFRQSYLARTDLIFDAEIDGETVRLYRTVKGHEAKDEEGDLQTYIEVTKEDGRSIIYADTSGTYNPTTYSDMVLDEIVFIVDDEVRVYGKTWVDWAKVIKDGEVIIYPQADYSSDGFTVPVLEAAQEQFISYMKGIDEYEYQQDMRYYNSTLVPLQEWALEILGSEPAEPVEPAPEPVVVEPEPVDVEARGIHDFIWEGYISRSALAWDEQTGRALVRKYVDEYDYSTNLVVDQADGTSLFFSDWLDDGHLDSFAITTDEQTVFFERFKMRIFRDREGRAPETLNKMPPGNIWAEAERLFEYYLLKVESPEAESPEEKDQYSDEEMESWALDELRED